MFKRLGIGALALGFATAVFAEQWKADEVDVSFLTTKVSATNGTVTELNTFDKASATLNFDGKLDAVIDLGSVNSGIEIRDQRLQDHIFSSVKNMALLVSGKVDLSDINQLEVGQSLVLHQPLHLTFGGKEIDVSAELLVVRQADNQLSVTSLKPMILDLTLFDVDQGVNKLTELAGLNAIALQVPTFLHAAFTRIGQ